ADCVRLSPTFIIGCKVCRFRLALAWRRANAKRKRTVTMTWLYCSAILLGSCLLFLVQPMCAKTLLPLLGGTPAVWNTCMVFFQAGLLAGYAYAHAIPGRLGVRRHAVLHILILIAAYFLLPIRLPDE